MVGLRGSSRDLEERERTRGSENIRESRVAAWRAVPLRGGGGGGIALPHGNKQRDEKGYLGSRSDRESRYLGGGGEEEHASRAGAVGSIFEDAEAARTVFGGRVASVCSVFSACGIRCLGGAWQRYQYKVHASKREVWRGAATAEARPPGSNFNIREGARRGGSIQIQINDGLSAESTLLFKSEGADRRTQGQIAERGVGVGGRGASAMDIHIDSASRRQAERAHPSPRPTREQNGARIRIERIRGRRGLGSSQKKWEKTKQRKKTGDKENARGSLIATGTNKNKKMKMKRWPRIQIAT
ncbi:hypothetical protein DFH09DRAFT_1394492 [Mycena vulgaris]|nr:hypothetical protein DFH09DRAFT_1394492 [Mycena vulgaris]